jgi:hypothetical protein
LVRDELSGPSSSRLRKDAERLMMTPTFEFDRRGVLHPRYRYMAQDLRAALAYGVLLIRDKGRKFGEDLKQCRLAGCGRYFLASDQVKDPSAPGRRRHRYCSREHMDAGQNTSAERTRRWRNKHK